MRVFCRIKPIDELDTRIGNESSQCVITFPQKLFEKNGENTKHQTLELNSHKNNGNKFIFNFDRVFTQENTQSDVFEEIKPFVLTALDGMNTCIFAYGQTGSGKTFTMEGPTNRPAALVDANTQRAQKYSGILPRIAILLQSEMERYEKTLGKDLKIEVSALEIYCENIRDLLSTRADQYLDLKNSGGKTVCPGQTWVKIFSPQDFLKQIEISQSKRIFKDNGMNQRSSRSHHVF